MNRKSISTLGFCAFFFFYSCSALLAQHKKNSQTNFLSPIAYEITLSGTFAELRSDHFHSGIDIRTFTTGKKIYAVDDGFVSRIKVSANGYGKALYITHPNGYTSVYAHLDRFNPAINEFVEMHQYRKESFEFDLHLKHSTFPVKKGELIALSGNTGRSGGPHLHFEIRDTKTQHPLNPLLFGFRVQDTTAPKIFNLYVYPMDSASSVNGKNTRQKFLIEPGDTTYHLAGNAKLKLAGKIGFALHANDYSDKSPRTCGIYALEQKVNDSLISSYKFNEFSFGESRYINSHIDYDLHISQKLKIHKCFKEENNKLSIYNEFANRGIYTFEAGKSYQIDFGVYDIHNNVSKLQIAANGVENPKPFKQPAYNCLFSYSKANDFETEDIKLKFPKQSFYRDVKFTYSKKEDSSYYSAIHSVHKNTVPIHQYYTMAIKLNRKVTDKNKLFVASIHDDGLKYIGGAYFNGEMIAKTRTFGNFAVMQDTAPPQITPKTNFKLDSLCHEKQLSFLIKDELSGIKSFKGTIDGKWVLFEYDAKNNHLFYRLDAKRLLPKQNHELKLELSDKLGNQSQFQTFFFW